MYLSVPAASGLLGSRRSSGTGTALLWGGLTGCDGLGLLLLAQPLIERADTLALDDGSICCGGIFDLMAASRRASETSGTGGLRKIGGHRGSEGGGRRLTLLLCIGGSIIINHLVEWRTILPPRKELARFDGVTRQRLNVVQDVLIALQQVGASSEETQLISGCILIIVIESVENFLATAVKEC